MWGINIQEFNTHHVYRPGILEPTCLSHLDTVQPQIICSVGLLASLSSTTEQCLRCIVRRLRFRRTRSGIICSGAHPSWSKFMYSRNVCCIHRIPCVRPVLSVQVVTSSSLLLVLEPLYVQTLNFVCVQNVEASLFQRLDRGTTVNPCFCLMGLVGEHN